MKWLVSTLVASLFLVGCGSSSDSANSKSTTQTVTEEKEVHLIQPDKINDYIETFKHQQSQLSLQLDGQETEFTFVDMVMDQNLIIAQTKQGLLLIGFDFENEEALANLTMYLSSETDVNTIIEKPDAVLQGINIELDSQDEQSIYQGSLFDNESQNSTNIRLVINESLISAGNSQLELDNDKAIVTGTLGTQFYIQLTELIAQHPEVTTLVLQNVQGSINDAINMHSGRLVRNAQLTTLMPGDGEAYSGGVDLYAAGFERQYQEGGKLGVHSWCCVDGKDAGQLGKDHEGHGAQLTYVREMLGKELGPEFYFFTIDAAPFDGMHVMTFAEVNKYFLQD